MYGEKIGTNSNTLPNFLHTHRHTHTVSDTHTVRHRERVALNLVTLHRLVELAGK